MSRRAIAASLLALAAVGPLGACSASVGTYVPPIVSDAVTVDVGAPAVPTTTVDVAPPPVPACVETIVGIWADDPAEREAAASLLAAWLAEQVQPVEYRNDYYFDGNGTPVGWSPTEDSDICVL